MNAIHELYATTVTHYMTFAFGTLMISTALYISESKLDILYLIPFPAIILMFHLYHML